MLLAAGIKEYLEYMVNIERSAETVRSYNSHYKLFIKHLESHYNCQVYIEDITKQDVDNYLAHLRNVCEYKPTSRAHVVNALRPFFRYSLQREWIVKNIMLSVDNIKVPQKERNYLTAVEVNQLVDKIDHSLVRLVSWFLFRTGLRISECLNLTINDVDFAKRQITIIAGKGNKDRIIPMSASVWERLYVYLQSERPSSASTLFFITKRSGKLTRTTVNNKLKYAAQNLGWTQPVTAHVLRHSFSFNLIKNKVSIVEVQKLLGHTSLAVTSVYAHTDLDELTKAVNTLL